VGNKIREPAAVNSSESRYVSALVAKVLFTLQLEPVFGSHLPLISDFGFLSEVSLPLIESMGGSSQDVQPNTTSKRDRRVLFSQKTTSFDRDTRNDDAETEPIGKASSVEATPSQVKSRVLVRARSVGYESSATASDANVSSVDLPSSSRSLLTAMSSAAVVISQVSISLPFW
jgi:hypothetical protein